MGKTSRLLSVVVLGLSALACNLAVARQAKADTVSPSAARMMLAPAPLAPVEGAMLVAPEDTGDTGPKPAGDRIFGPAPGLSQMWVLAVGSSACGWERMTTRGQFSTTCDHGGNSLRVAVMEIGYGDLPLAWINGGQLPRSANYESTPVCVVNNQYTWPCPAGYTVVGFLRYWNLDGNQGGNFQTSDTSTNAPHNTLSTMISIQ